MQNSFYKTEQLLGDGSIDTLRTKTVAVFGLGGVGSYVVEGLARSGIGHFILIDNDVISRSNLNRQIYALHSTIGKPKVDLAKKRILDINPSATVSTHKLFYLPDKRDPQPPLKEQTPEHFTTQDAQESLHNDKHKMHSPREEHNKQITTPEEYQRLHNELRESDYIVDAVDTVGAKIAIIERALKFNIPHISSMGTGNKLDPTKFKITDIYKTSVCPLARVMRHELKKRNIPSCKVLFSTEQPIDINYINHPDQKSSSPASVAFVPPVAGLLIAREVILDLLKK